MNKRVKETLEQVFSHWDIDEVHSLYNALAASIGGKCSMCGKPSGSPDPDVLCKQCREDFGHAFYSEL